MCNLFSVTSIFTGHLPHQQTSQVVVVGLVQNTAPSSSSSTDQYTSCDHDSFPTLMCLTLSHFPLVFSSKNKSILFYAGHCSLNGTVCVITFPHLFPESLHKPKYPHLLCYPLFPYFPDPTGAPYDLAG